MLPFHSSPAANLVSDFYRYQVLVPCALHLNYCLCAAAAEPKQEAPPAWLKAGGVPRSHGGARIIVGRRDLHVVRRDHHICGPTTTKHYKAEKPSTH